MNVNYKYLEIKHQNDTCEVWLNRPEKGNALDIDMIREVYGFFSVAEALNARFIVIRSKGKHFSVGADLNWMSKAVNLPHDENLAECIELANMFDSIRKTRKITIAIVEGSCYGGGIGLAASCDFIIASEASIFSFGESRLGLVPAVIAPYIINRIGKHRALRLMLTGKEFHSEEAFQYELIDFIAGTSADKNAELNNLLHQLREGNVSSQQKIKDMMLHLFFENNAPALRVKLAGILAESRISEEGMEGIFAFLEKRDPHWK